MLPQFEKNQEILPSTSDEALFCCSVMREILPFLLSLRSVLGTPYATQEVPRHNCVHLSGTPRVLPQLKKSSGIPSSSRDEDPFPCFVEKGILAFLWHLRRRRSQLEPRKELQGSCHYSQRPQCPNPLQILLTPLHCLNGHPENRLKTRWQV